MSDIFIDHPLPWSIGNTLIFDGRGKLIDIGRAEVRELLVELVNELGAEAKEADDGKDDGKEDARHD